MTRHDVQIDGLHSKSWDIFENKQFDLVVTVCDSAASETCPVFAGDFKRVHWSIPDPAAVTGPDQIINAAFEDTFNDIKTRVETAIL